MVRATVLALFLVFTTSAGSQTDVSTCAEGDGEVTSLMQQRLRQDFRPVETETKPRSAVAFEGGGWLAQFAEMAVLIGIGASAAPESNVTSLLRGFDIISSTSGGTWLTTSMIYSATYAEWMEELKHASADDIPSVFATYIERLRKVIPMCSVAQTGKYAAKLAAKLITYGYVLSGSPPEVEADTEIDADSQLLPLNAPTTGAQEACQMFNNDWATIVPNLLFATADIPREATLAGQFYNDWAADKNLVATVSIPMRTNADTDWYPKSANNFVEYNGPLRPAVKYDPLGHSQNMPAKISWRIGASSLEAPLSFCADDACGGIQYVYSGNKKQTVPMAAMWKNQYTDSAGNLEVTMVAAASSAFDGSASVARSRKSGLLAVTGEAAVWAATSSKGSVFAGGSVKDDLPGMKLADQTELAAERQLHALTDGGNTDLTSMCQAVAAGAEFVVSLQIAHQKGGLPDSFDMFTSDGHNGMGPVFDVGIDEMHATFNNTDNWLPFTPPADETEPSGLLKIVSFEKNLTTVEHPFFGIRAGRRVRVLFVFVSTDPGLIGIAPPFNTFSQYGLLIRDMVKLLVGKPDYARKLAEQFADR